MPKVDFLRSIAINLGRIPVSKQPIISKRENAAACEKYGKKPKAFLQEFSVENGYESMDPANWLCFCPKNIPCQENNFDCVLSSANTPIMFLDVKRLTSLKRRWTRFETK
uniref:Uncharacterized protein n=1 Tax=Ditylenchus dipsaci TaxID=166011 RepID=A0A915E378_9BILA